jgi:hypothetical protein
MPEPEINYWTIIEAKRGEHSHRFEGWCPGGNIGRQAGGECNILLRQTGIDNPEEVHIVVKVFKAQPNA